MIPYRGRYPTGHAIRLLKALFNFQHDFTFSLAACCCKHSEPQILRPDISLMLHRYCSEAFHMIPYRGRYPQGGQRRSTTPDLVNMQRLLAGIADRGAKAAIIEASIEALHCGRYRLCGSL